ncbi:MAG: ABC transporter ATP-binding protein, partial [Cytophagales bacterium]|nr:ABC transporter ATP-binding protein [Cytophaga sp.]
MKILSIKDSNAIILYNFTIFDKINTMTKSTLLFRWLYKEKTIISKIYLLALLQGILYLSIPLGIQGVITYIMAGSFSASLILLSSITIAITVFIAFFQLWQMRINETLHQKIFGDISSIVNSYLTREDVSSEKLSDINKFTEVVTLQKGISKILLEFSFSIISIVFGLLILPAYSSWFLLFTILLSTAFYFIISYYGKQGIETNVETSNEKYKLLEWFQKNALTSGKFDVTIGSEALLTKYFLSRRKHFSILETQFKAIIIFKVVFISILLFLGAYLVQHGNLNIGQFIASEIIIFLVINAVEKLVGSLNTCYDIVTALYKIEKAFGDKDALTFVDGKHADLKSMVQAYVKPYSKVIKYSLAALCLSGLFVLCMPWTQNIRSTGKVTTLSPQSRPQAITSRIAGRIEKWYI